MIQKAFDLLEQKELPGFFEKTKSQFQKDFELAGFDPDFLDKKNIQELVKYASLVFEHLANTDSEKLYALLYIMDVSSEKLHQLADENQEAKFSDVATYLAIERVAQKVFFKLTYS